MFDTEPEVLRIKQEVEIVADRMYKEYRDFPDENPYAENGECPKENLIQQGQYGYWNECIKKLRG